jgi:hypothetical protein
LRQRINREGGGAGLVLIGLVLLPLWLYLSWLESGVFEGFPLLPLLATFAALFWVFLAARALGLRERLRQQFQQGNEPAWAGAALRGVVLVPAAVLPALLLFLFPEWLESGAPGATAAVVLPAAMVLAWAALLGFAWWLGGLLKAWLGQDRGADVVWLLLLGVPFGLPVLLLPLLSLSEGTFTTSPWGALFFHRALDFSSGVSPLMPLLFMSLTFFCWAFFRLQRLRLLDLFPVHTPFPEPTPHDPSPGKVTRLFGLIGPVHRELSGEMAGLWRVFHGHYFALVLIGGVAMALVFQLTRQYMPTAEGPVWDLLFWSGFVVAFVLLVADLARFLFLWSRVKRLLDRIALVPILRAFERLPTTLLNVFNAYLYQSRPRRPHLALVVHQLGVVVSLSEALVPKFDNLPGEPVLDREEIEGAGRQADRLRAQGENLCAASNVTGQALRDFRNELSALAQRYLRLLVPLLVERPLVEAYGTGEPAKEVSRPRETALEATDVEQALPAVVDTALAPQGAGEAARAREKEASAMRQRWVDAVEGFVAIQILIYISQFFVRLRTTVWSLIVCSTLLLFAATSYPFNPERLLLLFLLGLSGSIMLGIVYALVQMNRDDLISRVSRTTPNRFTLDAGFVSSVFTYIIPAAGLVATQLSGGFRFLLEPLLRLWE